MHHATADRLVLARVQSRCVLPSCRLVADAGMGERLRSSTPRWGRRGPQRAEGGQQGVEGVRRRLRSAAPVQNDWTVSHCSELQVRQRHGKADGCRARRSGAAPRMQCSGSRETRRDTPTAPTTLSGRGPAGGAVQGLKARQRRPVAGAEARPRAAFPGSRVARGARGATPPGAGVLYR